MSIKASEISDLIKARIEKFQSATEARIEPAELHSILARGGLVGLLLAPPDYGVLPGVLGTFAASMDAPEFGARAVEPFLCFLAIRGATRSAYAASAW